MKTKMDLDEKDLVIQKEKKKSCRRNPNHFYFETHK